MTLERLTSIKDPRVVEARTLASTAGRLATGLCQACGEQQIQWALASPAAVLRCFVAADFTEHPLAQRLVSRGAEVLTASEGILRKITETQHLIPLIAVVKAPLPTPAASPTDDLIAVLDAIQDPGNLGTIVRTASAFHVRQLVATGPARDLFSRKAIDASRGLVFHAALFRADNAHGVIKLLRQNTYTIVATAPRAAQLQSAVQVPKGRVALILGNETDGVCEELLTAADRLVRIPMDGELDSLNVGVAAGISLYEMKVKVLMSMFAERIRSTLGRELNVSAKLFRQAFEAAWPATCPMTGSQAVFLMVLRCDEEMPLDRVAGDLGVSEGEARDFLAPLVEDGRVIYSSEAGSSVRLTAHGSEQLAQAWPLVQEVEAELLRGLSEDDIRALQDFLSRIQANCSDPT